MVTEDTNMEILKLHENYKQRRISPVEIVEYVLARMEKYSNFNSYITICESEAKQTAKQAEKLFNNGGNHCLLTGIPIGLKDLIYTKGIRTTCGSGVYKDFIPDKDASVVQLLKKYTSVIIGKQNMHEFAYGTTGDDSFFGPTKNPYNPNKITGGSSGGSACATALGLCSGSLGSDTSGSIRIPAAICGVVGMKPTFGKIATEGIYPLSWSMDHIGPITKTVMDNAILFDAITNHLSTHKSISKQIAETASFNIKGVNVGIPIKYFYENIQDEIKKQMNVVIDTLEKLGATIVEVDVTVEKMDDVMRLSSAIDRSEAYLINKDIAHDTSNILGDETRKRILQGSEYRAYEYVIAQELKGKLANTFRNTFKKVDVLLTPTLPILPPDIGEEEIVMNGKDFNVRESLMRFTFIANYIGIPSISLPGSVSDEGKIPIGVQLMGGWHEEEILYKVAHRLEKTLDLGKELQIN